MHPILKVDISELSVSERIQLAEDLWDSILTTDNGSIPILNKYFTRHPLKGAANITKPTQVGFVILAPDF